MTRSLPRSPSSSPLMFVVAPVLIVGAPYESSMGLVQKIFYFHFPSWMAMFAATAVCGVASARVLFMGGRSRTSTARRGGGTGRRVRLDRADHGAALGPQGVGRLVVVGRAGHVGARAVADVRLVPAAAPFRRTRVGTAVGGGGTVRDVQRAVRLLVGQPVADAPSEDVGGADACRWRWACRSGSRRRRSSASSCCC